MRFGGELGEDARKGEGWSGQWMSVFGGGISSNRLRAYEMLRVRDK